MREIGISPRFSRDKFVPLQTKQRYSTRDISGEVSLTLFFRGFVPFLSLADFVSRNKNLQVADLQRLKSCFGELVTATTRKDPFRLGGGLAFSFSHATPPIIGSVTRNFMPLTILADSNKIFSFAGFASLREIYVLWIRWLTSGLSMGTVAHSYILGLYNECG